MLRKKNMRAKHLGENLERDFPWESEANQAFGQLEDCLLYRG